MGWAGNEKKNTHTRTHTVPRDCHTLSSPCEKGWRLFVGQQVSAAGDANEENTRTRTPPSQREPSIRRALQQISLWSSNGLWQATQPDSDLSLLLFLTHRLQNQFPRGTCVKKNMSVFTVLQ